MNLGMIDPNEQPEPGTWGIKKAMRVSVLVGGAFWLALAALLGWLL